MTSQEEAILAQVDAQLNAMDAPSSAEVFYGLEEFSPRHQVAAAARVAKAGGGGGPGLHWSNVATITYADILAAGSGVPIDVVTIATGTFFDAWYLHYTENFDDSGGMDYALGWDLAGTPRLANINMPTPLAGPNSGADVWTGVSGVSDGQSNPGFMYPLQGDSNQAYMPLILDADVAGPLQIVFASISEDGETGSFDLWLRTQAPA